MNIALLKKIFCLVIVFTTTANAEVRIIKVGTGNTSSVYYPVGGAVCRYAKDAGESYNKNVCFVKATDGSRDNINRLISGDIDLGIVESDMLVEAYNSEAESKQLRVLFTLHEQDFTIVTTKASGIKTFEDLRGRRVNVGIPESGTFVNAERLLKTLGHDQSFFGEAVNFKDEEALNDLCSGNVDATFYMTGHPDLSVRSALSKCDATMIDIPSSAIATMTNNFPYYIASTIPANTYVGQSAVKTFGLVAVMVGTEKLASEMAYTVTKITLTNIRDFRKVHPTLKNLDTEKMSSYNFGVPFHQGVERYHKENQLEGVAYP